MLTEVDKEIQVLKQNREIERHNGDEVWEIQAVK